MEKKDLESAEIIAKLTSQVQYFRDYSLEVNNKAIAIAQELDKTRFLLIAYMIKNNVSGFSIGKDFLPKIERFIGSGLKLMTKQDRGGWAVEFQRGEEEKIDA